MKYSIFIEPEREDEIIIYTQRKTELIERIEKLITNDKSELIGYSKGEITKLDILDVMCFSVEDGKVFALTKQQKYALKERLYQLEERFPEFVKINQSCLVRVDKIKRFDSSIGGSLMVTLECGYRDYISRRQLKTVKERIGF